MISILKSALLLNLFSCGDYEDIQSMDELSNSCSSQISNEVHLNLEQIQTCFAVARSLNRTVSGRVVVETNIETGVVFSTNVYMNTTGDSDLGLCIEQEIKNWYFPEYCSETAVFPFAFN